MNVITCSRQSGSRGEEIIELLARELGLRQVDKESIEHILVNYGIPERSVERYDEKKPGFWELISSDRERYYHCLKSAILETAREGDCIIIGRGAPVLLAGIPGVLHLRIIAPLELRISRTMEAHSCSEDQAKKMLHESDHNRAGFYRYFFDADWQSPDLYDLVINTGLLTPDNVLALVRTILASPQYADNQETHRRLQEISLAQRILKQILVEEQIPVRFPSVDVVEGVATLYGIVNAEGSIERCRAIAEKTEGITRVDMQISHAPDIYDGPFM